MCDAWMMKQRKAEESRGVQLGSVEEAEDVKSGLKGRKGEDTKGVSHGPTDIAGS